MPVWPNARPDRAPRAKAGAHKPFAPIVQAIVRIARAELLHLRFNGLRQQITRPSAQYSRQYVFNFSWLNQANNFSINHGVSLSLRGFMAVWSPATIRRLALMSPSPRFLHSSSPIAFEAVKKIDAIFAIERAINGFDPSQRHSLRQAHVKTLVDELHTWMLEERKRISSKIKLANAMDYMLKRWASFARFLDDGRLCLTNNAAERALRCIAVGRRNWTFAGSDRGGERAAAIYTLIQTAKLNGVDPQAWLADVLARIAETPIQKLDQLLPWSWRPHDQAIAA